MLKQFIVAVFILSTSIALAQEGTRSPYSYYGIGTLKFKGTTENRSMGGISILSDSIHMNLQNPAAIADLRLVNYTVGASHQYTTLNTANESQKASATSLEYIAVGIPMGKFGASFGLIPYTSVGYQIESVDGDDITQYGGTGGVNKVFLNLGYKINDAFNIGVTTDYNFGSIENTTYTRQGDAQFGTQEFLRSELSGFSFNLGANYKTMLTDNLQLSTSLAYSLESDFRSKNLKQIGTVQELPLGGVRPIDLRDVDVADSDFTFPSKYTIGAGIGKPKNWFVGLEYGNQKTSNLNNRTIEVEGQDFEDANSFRLGGYYIPNYNSVGSFWKRSVYRAGMRFEETGIVLNGEKITEFGISFGVGLPVGKIFSNANIGFEIGKRGVKDFGLVQENFFNTFLSLSLNDRWFEKRYYD